MSATVLSMDDAMRRVGEFGRFQYLIEAMFCLLMIPGVLQILIVYFTAYNPGWRCVNGSSICQLNGTMLRASDGYGARCSMPRSEWEYVQEENYSIVTQFGLFCDKENLIYVVTSVFFLAWGVGSPILGWLQDRYGRVRLVLPCFAMMITAGLLSAFSPGLWMFILARFIMGFITSGTGVAMFVLISELVGPEHRPLAGMTLWIFFTLALILIGIQAYFVRQWKTLTIICSAPYFVTLLFFKFIPESIRWLRLKGREDEAMKVLSKIAKINKKEAPSFKLEPANDHGASEASVVTLVKNKALFVRTSALSFCWLIHGMVYYGLTLASDDLGGSIYRDYILSSLVEFPAAVLAIIGCNKIGRKWTVLSTQIISALCCIAVAAIPLGGGWMSAFRVAVGMAGKLFVTTSFDGIYTWSVEIYPTAVRSGGMGTLQVASRIGAAMSPWVAKWLQGYGVFVPFVVMGTTGLISGGLMFILPETKGRPTPETVEERTEHDDVQMKAMIANAESDTGQL